MKGKLDVYYAESISSMKRVKEWFENFCSAPLRTSDAKSSSLPLELPKPDNIDKFHGVVVISKT